MNPPDPAQNLFQARDRLQVRSVQLDSQDPPQRQREKLARILLDDMYQFVALLSCDGTLLEVNRAALEGGGIALEDIIGKPFWEAHWWTIASSTRQRLQQSITSAANGTFIRYDVEVYGRAAGEETIVIDFSLRPVTDVDGRVSFLLAEGRDITEKKAAEAEVERKTQELQALYERVKEVDELKSQFFANVSHELRTPLALILGPGRRLAADQQLDSQSRDDARIICRNTSMLLKQVNDLLDVAKLDAGQMQLAYAKVDLAKLLRLVASNFTGLAQDQLLDFQTDLPEELDVECDADQMERITLNLLSNAFKFTPRSGAIRLHLSADDDEVALSVADSGPGIPEDLRPHLFERFRQGDGGATREVGGTGLGLAIVKDFVELHGGSIAVDASQWGGALITITLPRRAPPHQTVSLSPGAQQLNEVPLQGSLEELRQHVTPSQHRNDDLDLVNDAANDRPRVLVVEDNPDLRSFLVRLLSPSYSVFTASDGEDGLAQIRRHVPHCILTDLMMPRVSGDQMLERLRKIPDLASIPAIVLSAKADEEQWLHLLGGLAQDYLLKPFVPDEVLARIENLVELSLYRSVLHNRNLQLEKAVTLRSRELSASETRFRQLADAMPQVVWSSDEKGVVDYCNRRWQAFDVSDDHNGYGSSWHDLVHPEDRHPTIDAWMQAVREGHAYQIEHRIRQRDRSYRWMLSRGVPGRNAQGHIDRWYGTATDIHDLKSTEQELQQRTRELRLANKDLEQFAYIASHDLQEPLRTVAMNIDVIERRLVTDDAQLQRAFAHVRGGAMRMSDLIRNVMLYSRIELDGLEPDSQTCTPQDAIDQAQADLAFPLQMADATVQVRCDPGVAACPAAMLVQVLQNLLSNACKYRDELPLQIHITATRAADRWTVTIDDNGIGVPAHATERVFDMFHRLRPKDTVAGSGIGLSLCRKVVEHLGGTIWCESLPQGSRFAFTLPTRSTPIDAARNDLND